MTSAPIDLRGGDRYQRARVCRQGLERQDDEDERAEVEREVEVLRVVASAIEQRQDSGQRRDQDEEHARHGLAGATHQPPVVLGHRAEHAAKQPGLGFDLAFEQAALGLLRLPRPW